MSSVSRVEGGGIDPHSLFDCFLLLHFQFTLVHITFRIFPLYILEYVYMHIFFVVLGPVISENSSNLNDIFC